MNIIRTYQRSIVYLTILAAMLCLFVLTACGGEATEAERTAPTTASIAALFEGAPPCPEIGDVLTEEAMEGCMVGNTLTLSVYASYDTCTVAQFDGYWAILGQPVQAGEAVWECPE
jgi:hypothetical protein